MQSIDILHNTQKCDFDIRVMYHCAQSLYQALAMYLSRVHDTSKLNEYVLGIHFDIFDKRMNGKLVISPSYVIPAGSGIPLKLFKIIIPI